MHAAWYLRDSAVAPVRVMPPFRACHRYSTTLHWHTRPLACSTRQHNPLRMRWPWTRCNPSNPCAAAAGMGTSEVCSNGTQALVLKPGGGPAVDGAGAALACLRRVVCLRLVRCRRSAGRPRPSENNPASYGMQAFSEGHNNLGHLRQQQGQLRAAIAHFRQLRRRATGRAQTVPPNRCIHATRASATRPAHVSTLSRAWAHQFARAASAGLHSLGMRDASTRGLLSPQRLFRAPMRRNSKRDSESWAGAADGRCAGTQRAPSLPPAIS